MSNVICLPFSADLNWSRTDSSGSTVESKVGCGAKFVRPTGAPKARSQARRAARQPLLRTEQSDYPQLSPDRSDFARALSRAR